MSFVGTIRAVGKNRQASNSLRRAAVSLSNAASKRLADMIQQQRQPVAGFRLGVKKRGCSGNSYTLSFAEKHEKNDEIVETQDGVKLFIDPQALLYVVGTEMDFEDKELESGFVFSNPNIKATCGCGESFNL